MENEIEKKENLIKKINEIYNDKKKIFNIINFINTLNFN